MENSGGIDKNQKCELDCGREREYARYLEVLREELIPAAGCTEPVAMAYAAALCREILGEAPLRALVRASGGLIKNVKSVYVPNTGGLKGIEAAIAAGVTVAASAAASERASDKGLEILGAVADGDQAKIRRFVSEVDVRTERLESDDVFDLIVTLWSAESCARVRLTGSHTNVVLLERDGRLISAGARGSALRDSRAPSANADIAMAMAGIWDFAMNCRLEDVSPILDRQIEHNMAIAEEGMRKSYGAAIGSVMLSTYGYSLSNRAAAMAAAASDARMSGCDMPVVINSGSGNQGIACSVPVIVFAQGLGSSRENLYRALVLSNLVTIYQKAGVGKLSAFCGAVCAGASAGAGIAYLRGGGLKEASHAVVNALAILSGMVCDGAKASCAAKIAFAVNAGLLGLDMYALGRQFRGGDGIVTKGVDNTIRNIGRLGRDGMRETDEEIINIMIRK